MRRSWCLAGVALFVCACTADVDRAWDAVNAESQPVAGPPDYLKPAPAAITAIPDQYVSCIKGKQAAVEYDALWGKLFITGGFKPGAKPDSRRATPNEQWAIGRWELERKDCLNQLDPFLDYFAKVDTTITRRFEALQATIRTAHIELSHSRATYGQAVSTVRAAERAFWSYAAKHYPGMGPVLEDAWLDRLPTM